MMLWAMLKAHMKMEEYIQAEFKDHPTIASEYVKFLATNSGYETVTTLQAKINSLEKELGLIKKSVTNAANAADAANKVAGEAKKIAEKNSSPSSGTCRRGAKRLGRRWQLQRDRARNIGPD